MEITNRFEVEVADNGMIFTHVKSEAEERLMTWMGWMPYEKKADYPKKLAWHQQYWEPVGGG